MAVMDRSIGETPGERLFVTKIAPSIQTEDLQSHFSNYGTVTDVFMPRAPGMSCHKGIAFVSFQDPISIAGALQGAPHTVNGLQVVVDVAVPRAPLGEPQSAPKFDQGGSWGPGGAQGGGAGNNAVVEADRLFVTKVPPTINSDNLAEYFTQFGELTDLYMPSVPGSGGHKGICFVSFKDPACISLVLQQQSHEIQGQLVVVDIAAPKSAEKGKGKGKGKAKGKDSYHGGGGAMNYGNTSFGGGYNSYGGYEKPNTFDAGFAAGKAAAAAQGGWGGKGGGYSPAVQAQQAAQATNAAWGADSTLGAGANGNAGAPTGPVVEGRLFVTKLPIELNKDDLTRYFQQYGDLTDVYVPPGKGIAFISFSDPAVAARALQTREHLVKVGTSMIVVDQAVDRPGKGKGKGKDKGYSPY